MDLLSAPFFLFFCTLRPPSVHVRVHFLRFILLPYESLLLSLLRAEYVIQISTGNTSWWGGLGPVVLTVTVTIFSLLYSISRLHKIKAVIVVSRTPHDHVLLSWIWPNWSEYDVWEVHCLPSRDDYFGRKCPRTEFFCGNFHRNDLTRLRHCLPFNENKGKEKREYSNKEWLIIEMLSSVCLFVSTEWYMRTCIVAAKMKN